MGPQEYDPWLRVKEAGVPSLREGLSELRAEVVPRNPRSCFSWRERSQRRGERAHRCLVHRRVCGHSRHPSEVAGGNGLPREVLGCPEEQGAYAPGDISLDRPSLGDSGQMLPPGYLPRQLWVSLSRASTWHKLMTGHRSPVSFLACQQLWERPCRMHFCVSAISTGGSCVPRCLSLGSLQSLKVPLQIMYIPLPSSPPPAALKIFLCVCFSIV